MLIYRTRDEFNQLCQVRRAGRSVRLYTNGVFHSQYHPDKLLEGNLWDLLWLPALALESAPRRILVLGVGGGAVMGKLSRLFPDALVMGVDISRTHLRIARHYFGVKGPRIALYCADALAIVRYYRGPKFDLVVDDLFAGAGHEPRRVVCVDRSWLAQLHRVLEPRGTLVANFASAGECRAAWREGCWPSGLSLSHRRYDNAVAGFYSAPVGDPEARVLTRLEQLGAGGLGNDGISLKVWSR